MTRRIYTREEPLFIVGCVRSGTTMVRNLLRRQPNFLCPEETHYYRYGEPYHTRAHNAPFTNSETLRKHREIDGLPDDVFQTLYTDSRTRGELLFAHVSHMARERGLPEGWRWFDKTPQNVYGMALMRAEFPKARFLHLVRHPLNVVASLKVGKVIKVADVIGAANYWLEAVKIVRTLAPILGDDLLELRYEDIGTDPVAALTRISEFARLPAPVGLYAPEDVYEERNQYLSVLGPGEIKAVWRHCGRMAEQYGYAPPV